MMNDRVVGRRDTLSRQRRVVDKGAGETKYTVDRDGKTINIYFTAGKLNTLNDLNEVVSLLGISRSEYIINLIRNSLTSS